MYVKENINASSNLIINKSKAPFTEIWHLSKVSSFSFSLSISPYLVLLGAQVGAIHAQKISILAQWEQKMLQKLLRLDSSNPW